MANSEILNYDNRRIFNLFINSEISTKNNKNRKFTSFDMLPTTLASIGATIENDQLGLGTNLFSEKKTLIEKYDIEFVNEELEKKSIFYNNNILYKK